MDRQTMDGGGAGFFHPFARSIARPKIAPVRVLPAPAPTGVHMAPARPEKIPATGGFINPYAINPQRRTERR